jgi:hypothetical protein
MVKYFSLGYRCTTTTLLKMCGLKTESYPFDWLISKLNIIRDCIDTNFVHFLNTNNYNNFISFKNYNIIDNNVILLPDENVNVNMFYSSSLNVPLYHLSLAMTHHNIHNLDNFAYLKICIKRLNDLFVSNEDKRYLYLNPTV